MEDTKRERDVTFTIHRTRRSREDAVDVPPLIVAFPTGPLTTVLDILERVRLSRDPSLMFRHSCHHGSCGTCACLINGKERLACTTRVHDLSASRVTVEPLRHFPRNGDLTSDFSTFFGEIPAHWTYLRESERPGGSRTPPGIEKFKRFEDCIECGCCVSACPVTECYVGPASLALLHREMQNNPANSRLLLAFASGDRGAKRCVRALECSRVCPSGVYPARHIADLKRLV